MAITGRFAADFSSFYDAVTQAQTKLVDLSSGAGRVEGALNRMVDNFSGRKLVQDTTLMVEAIDRVGGVSKLTEDELQRVGARAQEAAEKLRAIGQDVPAGIQRVADAAKQAEASTTSWSSALTTAQGYLGAFGIQATLSGVAEFGREVFSAADNLVRLSDKTGISLQGLQKFQIAGDDAGNTIEELTNAIAKMQDKLVSGDASAAGALDKLGLTFERLRGLSPEDQFILISEAIDRIKDPSEQVNIAIDLFGRQGANILPTLKRGFEDLRDTFVGMADSTIHHIDKMGDAWAKWKREAQAEAGEGLSFLVEHFTTFDDTAAALEKTLAAMEAAAKKAAPALQLALPIVPPKLPPDLETINRLFGEQEREINKMAEAMTELNSVSVGWQGTLATIDGEVADAIKYYLDAGVAQDKLATAYGLTAAQVKSVASAMKDEQEALKIESKAVEQATQLWDEYNALKVQHGGSSTDIQIAQIDRWYQDAVAKLTQMGTYNEETATAVWSVWQEKLAGVNVKWDEVNRHSKESLQDAADKARATADYVLANSSQFTADYVRLKQQEANAAERAAYHWRDTFDAAGRATVQSASVACDAIIAKFGQISHALQSVTLQMGGVFDVEQLTAQQFQQMGGEERIKQIENLYQLFPGRKSGGTGATGLNPNDQQGYLSLLQEERDYAALIKYAAEHPASSTSTSSYATTGGGPSIPTPPFSLTVPAGGGGSGVMQNITIHVNGTAEDVARQISESIMQNAMRGYQFSGN